MQKISGKSIPLRLIRRRLPGIFMTGRRGGDAIFILNDLIDEHDYCLARND